MPSLQAPPVYLPHGGSWLRRTPLQLRSKALTGACGATVVPSGNTQAGGAACAVPAPRASIRPRPRPARRGKRGEVHIVVLLGRERASAAVHRDQRGLVTTPRGLRIGGHWVLPVATPSCSSIMKST